MGGHKCSNGDCVFTANTGANCDDLNPCTENDKCQSDKTCKGTPKTCQANQQCSGGICVCNSGYYDADQNQSNGCECQKTNGGVEICDNKDNDCNGQIDEGCDDDDDNYCDKNMQISGTLATCTSGGNDCNDNNANINPGKAETCNSTDNG